MNKKMLLLPIAVTFLLVGCGKTAPTNAAPQTGQSSTVAATANDGATKAPGTTTPATTTTATATTTTSNTIDYNQYIRKTWVEKNGTSKGSFCITKIENGKITGRFTSYATAVPNAYDLGQLTGTISKNTAECQFSDTLGNKGNIKLVFKPNNEMEATIKLTEKSKYEEEQPKEGTFQFIPYNLKSIKGFSLFKDQTFMVNLDSWGTVKFVSGKLTAGSHIPTVFYLTDKDGNILYDFDMNPYNSDVKAVSFADINKDGLKDIIIIVAGNDGSGTIATVFFQKANGIFANDNKLDQEINASGKNKDVKTITSYLSSKF